MKCFKEIWLPKWRSTIVAGLMSAVSVGANADGNYRHSFMLDRPQAKDSTCAGIRGNGQNLFAHYGALARHVEEFGAITCAAGGSSGSITTFLLESMWANPSLHRCGRRKGCSDIERDAKLALMLKSVVGLVGTGLSQDVAIINSLLQKVQEEQVLELLNGPEPAEGVAAFVRILRDLGPLINADVIRLLLTSPNPVFHATDIIQGLQKGLQFEVDDPRVFLRTAVIDFDKFATLLGVYGSFYAGYGPADRRGMRRWFRRCASQGVGLTWQQLARLGGPQGQTCGDKFVQLFNQYRERFATRGGRNRADDRVGRYFPAFGVTGVLTGQAIADWEEARAAWLAADPIPFEPNFDDVGVGYWGKAREVRKMGRRLNRHFNDAVSNSFVPLVGRTLWREVLAASPAEPGFSPAVALPSGFVSVGGWADPLRVLPLVALGAKKTVTINRLGGVGGFTEAVTGLLNASDVEIEALYSLTDPSSSFNLSLEQASGVWCTDWDSQQGDPNRLFNDAYHSPLITSDWELRQPRYGYSAVGPNFQLRGCSSAAD